MTCGTRHRRGMTLVEVLAILPLLAAIGLIAVGLVIGSTRALSKTGRWTERDVKLAGLLKQVRQDMDDATDVQRGADDQLTIIIRTRTTGTVTYRTKDQLVSRYVGPVTDEAPAREWTLTGETLKWAVQHAPGGSVVELTITLRPDREDPAAQRVMIATFAPGLAPGGQGPFAQEAIQ